MNLPGILTDQLDQSLKSQCCSAKRSGLNSDSHCDCWLSTYVLISLASKNSAMNHSVNNRIVSLVNKATLFLMIVAFASLPGCGKDKGLRPISGSLEIDGKPPEGAVLLFFPQNPAEPVVSANTDTAGNFKLRTNGEWGAQEGQYTVTITWPDPKVKPTETQRMAANIPDPPDLLKGRYALKDKSKIQITIDSTTSTLEPMKISSK